MLQTNYVIYYLLGINALTFIIYASDKRSSRRQIYRVPEKTLLLLALVGGSPAAWLAQKIFHHKTKKNSFRLRFWLVVILQIIALIFYFMKYQ